MGRYRPGLVSSLPSGTSYLITLPGALFEEQGENGALPDLPLRDSGELWVRPSPFSALRFLICPSGQKTAI